MPSRALGGKVDIFPPRILEHPHDNERDVVRLSRATQELGHVVENPVPNLRRVRLVHQPLAPPGGAGASRAGSYLSDGM